jgi:hypothetical protein
VTVRRILTAASTVIVSIMLSIFVPLAQLPTIADEATCCCPDPHKCKCPDHKADHSLDSKMKACHKKGPALASVQLPAFVAPIAIDLPAPARASDLVERALPEPHASPPPRRPDAPS